MDPFFAFLSTDMTVMAFRICHSVVKSHQLAAGDLAFTGGDESSQMFVLKSGEYRYHRNNSTGIDPVPQLKQWLAEAVLWVLWRYQGDLTAESPCDLLSLGAQETAEVMCLAPGPWSFARRYGQQYVAFLKNTAPVDWSDMGPADASFYTRAV